MMSVKTEVSESFCDETEDVTEASSTSEAKSTEENAAEIERDKLIHSSAEILSQSALARFSLQNFLLASAHLIASNAGSMADKSSDSDTIPKEDPPTSTSGRKLRRKRKAVYDNELPLDTQIGPSSKTLSHSGAKKFKCSDCDKEFKNKGDLKSHSIKHSTARPFKCEICDSAFKSKRTLTSHVAIHATVKPFACDKCDKTFPTKAKAKDHSLCHLTEKAFKCCECDAEFKRKGNMKQHYREVHLSTRAFPCPDCGASFKRKGDLKMHGLTHLDEATMKLLDEELEYHLS